MTRGNNNQKCYNSIKNNMNCTKCNKEMIVKVKDISSNFRNGKKYDRIVYWCEKDDVWIRIETPKEV